MARVKTSAGAQSDKEDLSSRLATAIEDAEKETERDRARASFEKANAAREQAMDPRFEPLVERTFQPRDWISAIDAYEKWKGLGDRRTDEAFIRLAHERGAEIVQDLVDAWIQARYARHAWELENDVLFGSMREEALIALHAEKARGTRTKQIAERDVEAKAASLFPDEWPRQQSRRLKFKLAEDRMEAAVENAKLRCRILETMMSRLR